MKQLSVEGQRASSLGKLLTLSKIDLASTALLALFMLVILPTSVLSADRLIVKNESGATTFTVEESGAVTSASSLFTNGASAWGSAPFVLGQDV